MSGKSQSGRNLNDFGGLADDYTPKLSPKFKLLLPQKQHIEGLLLKRASYDDIRILLSKANIVVSKNTLYRFCREVIGRKPVRKLTTEKMEIPQVVPKIAPVVPLPASTPISIQTALQEQRRERLPGVWGRRKRGPRIADSKNL